MEVPPTDFDKQEAAESAEVEMEEQPSDSKMEEWFLIFLPAQNFPAHPSYCPLIDPDFSPY